MTEPKPPEAAADAAAEGSEADAKPVAPPKPPRTPRHTVAVWVGNATGEGRPGLTG
jgi:hypothetical protein